MGRLILAPIEPIEERYSRQWLDDFRDRVDVIVGSQEVTEIKEGEFLDVYHTNIYKLKQGIDLLETVRDDDYVLFLDLWNPVVINLAYYVKSTNMRVRIGGLLHAGTWDKHDFITRCGFREWATGFEQSLLKVTDDVFVATKFHKEMIENYTAHWPRNITVVPFPVFTPDIVNEKEDIVVFPHRLAPEKNRGMFELMKSFYEDKYTDRPQWIVSKLACKNKQEYYELLSRAKVSVSTAYQETFGIAMLESLNLGCVPVVPHRLSYVETLPEFTYEYTTEAVEMIHNGLVNYSEPRKYETTNFKHLTDEIRKRMGTYTY